MANEKKDVKKEKSERQGIEDKIKTVERVESGLIETMGRDKVFVDKPKAFQGADYFTFTGEQVPYSSTYIGINSDPAYTWG